MFNDSDYETDSVFEIPTWLKEHPELQQRGINLELPLRPRRVFTTSLFQLPQYAVKVLDPTNEEATICERLQTDLASPNHSVPCEVIRSGRRPVLLMPHLGELISSFLPPENPIALLDAFYQLAEGVEYLHRQRIAHLDIAPHNFIVSEESTDPSYDQRVELGKFYIIDFDRSRQFDLGPGLQPAIVLPETQCRKPDGIQMLDPYSWDVYCLGLTFEYLTEHACRKGFDRGIWRIVARLLKWMVGNELGCTSVCRCRPTARQVYQVLSIIRRFVLALEPYRKTMMYVRGLYKSVALR